MKITIIGSGYVGLVTGACFAEMGNDVWCVDIDEKKIEGLRNGIIPIYEPGLEDMIKRNIKAGRIGFTTDLARALTGCRVCFIAVGTPQDEDGSADVSHVLNAAREIGAAITGPLLVVNKSTCPVGTASQVFEKIHKYTGYDFNIASNPEFLKEGSAIQDFMMPDRIIIGVDSEEAEETLRELYAPFQRQGDRIIAMDIKSAELTKYAANAMLATRISFMNEMAELCEAVGADIEHVREGIGSDSRIGRAFLYAGIGYGGSCFPKDVRALNAMFCDNVKYSSTIILDIVEEANKRAAYNFGMKIMSRLLPFEGKTLAVWGLSFKPNTDDVRESPAIKIIEYLRDNGATFQVYDPAAMDTARDILGDRVIYCAQQYDALYNADALLLLTEWREFRNPDFDRVKALLKTPVIFDGRNQYDPAKMRELGIEYHCIGRSK